MNITKCYDVFILSHEIILNLIYFYLCLVYKIARIIQIALTLIVHGNKFDYSS